MNPTQLQRPAFLMNAPFSYSTAEANNVWMQEMTEAERIPDRKRSMVQFLKLYNFLAAEALVYLLPIPRIEGLQDLVFTANLGIVLEHVEGKNTVVISNYSSAPRQGETEVGMRFFESMGYQTYVPDAKFEGEAELKPLYDNIYVGGYGIRSDPEVYNWMKRIFDMRIIRLKMIDPYLYHLDCSVFPITKEQTLVCTQLYDEKEIKELEKYTEIIDVSKESATAGLCNSVRLNNTILCASDIHDLKAGTEGYVIEAAKNRELEDIAGKLAFEVTLFNLSEYQKSGAMLSCMMMHLNRHSYSFRLV
ncbi:Beta-hydroxylase, bleomycin/phleomycin binding protein, ankyrin homologue, bleomycin and transport protein [Candidatus Glomeribacter gigasporarum BEG34]|uniref:Beta-hydroxylase, bleomycin/phleomycin binding protein, ankyrin homologue, bleomycin and transport protein n=1 Tax=Candidatus Glomeribacter gigasporarum BEG34 TaxID=1070319 RepID=G2J9D7_9BURK|nr:arginine deiminase-related protein [Candidatus Glomeribacter gigasporarum]CCD29384.1 Beta-hydroxylase, bleomycin/phleomycin binding protein, ankyrin homologue, bleomycin and transport protein [Candidatus Glomeribacter gigasporarum BEG34]